MSRADITAGRELTNAEWGENSEGRILSRWAKLSKAAPKGARYVKTPANATLDFLVLDGKGLPAAYVEIKRRRTALAKYGDAICPWRKHTAAIAVAKKHLVPTFLVTEYGCGALIEVNLATVPAEKRDLGRRDRPNVKPSPHAFYTLEQLTVLAKESA